MKELAIIGAGGHTRTLINLIEENDLKIVGIFDNQVKSKDETILGYSVKLMESIPEDAAIVISKGEIETKKALIEQYHPQLLQTNLIHPKAVVETVNLGSGNQISPCVYAAPTSKIKNHNVIYSGTVIEHESVIGNYNTITVNVSICGRVTIGNYCYFGAGAVVLPNLTIADNVTIGAGCVVTKSISEPGTYVGVPAKKIA